MIWLELPAFWWRNPRPSATYSYLANSPLVSQIAFAHNGATQMTASKTYDNLNRLTGIVNGNGTIPAVDSRAYSYNPANQRTNVAEVDGTYWVYAYDSLGQVTSGIKHWSDGSLVAGQQFDYTFDTIGNRTGIQAGGDTNGANLRSASYTNNALNQISSRGVPGDVDVMGLTLATNTVSVNGTAATKKYEYFRAQVASNNTSAAQWVGISVTAPGQTTVSGHQFLPQTPEAFTYDLDGNLTQDGRWTYTWDAENRLINMTSLSGGPSGSLLELAFTYDYMGRRLQKIVSTNSSGTYTAEYTNNFVYDGWNPVVIVNQADLLVASLVWGLDLSGSMQGAGGVGGLLMENLVGNGAQFVGYDGNGNVVVLVSATNGTATANYEYGPFGEELRMSGGAAKLNPIRFSSKYDDDESDFLYYGYRYYNPSTGRWLSRDPVEEDGFQLIEEDFSATGNDWGPNLYDFVANDPLDGVDELGLMTYDQMAAEVKQIDNNLKAQAIPCCCSTPKVSAFLQPVTVNNGTNVTVAAHITTFQGTPDNAPKILKYYWWNCFRAHNEAVKAGVKIKKGDTTWQNYGWEPGGQTDTETAIGTSNLYDPYDAHHWNWMAAVVYQYCLGGILRADWVPTGQLQYTWSDYWPYGWHNPGPP
jgi:RHS repeat-associated protein